MMLANVGEEVADVTLTGTVNALLDIGSKVLGFITDNSLMMLCFSGCLVGTACYVVRRVKRTAIK